MVIQGGGALIESAGVPRIAKFEALEVEVMAELVAKRAQKRPERSDLPANRGAHPDTDQKRVGVIIAEKFGGRVLANAQRPARQYPNATRPYLIEIGSGVKELLRSDANVL